MKNYKSIYLLFVCTMAISAVAQQNYRIQYNVLTEKHEIFRENGTNKPDLVKRVRFHDGDVVKVTVNGYNPLKYFVVIKQNEVKTTAKADPKFLDEAKNFLGKSQNILSFLEDVELPFLGTTGGQENLQNSRGGEVKNEDLFFSKPEHFKIYTEYKNMAMKEISSYTQATKSYLALMELVKDKSTCSKENFNDIKIQLKTIRDSLSLFAFQSVLTNFNEAKNEFDAAEFKKSAALIMASDSDQLAKDVVQNHMHIRNDYDQLLTSWSNFNELFAKPNSMLSAEKIDELIFKIENLKFETEQVYMIHTSSSSSTFSGQGGSSEGVITDMDFTIDVFDVDKVLESAKKTQKLSRYVKYPNPGRYWTPDNLPTQTPCAACKPMIKAEGIIEGDDLPESYSALVNSEGELIKECVGKWIIYDDNGNVKNIKYPPSIMVLNGNAPGENGMTTFNNENLSESSVATKKSLRLPVAGAYSVNWTTGLIGVGALQGRNTFSTSAVGVDEDSLNIVKKAGTPLNVCLASVMSIDFLSGRKLVPGINLGVGVDLSSGRNLNYLLGFSLRPKKFPLFSLTGGMAYTPVNTLNADISEIRTYKQTEFYNTLGEGSLNVQKYQVGYYFGLHINL
jgi:hypothetical protein